MNTQVEAIKEESVRSNNKYAPDTFCSVCGGRSFEQLTNIYDPTGFFVSTRKLCRLCHTLQVDERGDSRNIQYYRKLI